MNHAFFKALLFLGAGAIIHSLADEQDLRRMGGLTNLMPLTYSLFLIGSISITGAHVSYRQCTQWFSVP
jgi:NADH-ubiquinone oxidoreductase chain 5